MWKKISLVSVLVVILVVGMTWQARQPALAQANNADVCVDVTYLMDKNITPYDMTLAGGVLQNGDTENGTIGAGAYADFWSFTLTRPRNQNNILQELPVTIRFTNVSGVPLEWALFNGLFAVIDYQPVTNGDIPYSPSAETGTYTLVVRKVNLADDSPASYGVTLLSDGVGAPVLSVRDETTNRDFFPAPELSNGVGRISTPAATVFIHPDGTRRIHPRGGQSTQIFMPNERGDFSAHTINIGNWANKLSFLGGDLAAVGEGRIYYHHRFDPRVNISGVTPAELNLQNVTYADGTIIRTDWSAIFGIWVMDDCVGFKLKDGRTFTAPTPKTGREIRAEGSLTGLMMGVNTLVDGASRRHIAVLDWTTVRDFSQVTLREGVYHLDLVAERELTVQSTDMTLVSQPSDAEIAPSTITLNDQAVTIVMNWVNIRAFSLRDNLITFDFLDAPRTTTTRDGTNISRIETIGEIIQLIYKEQAGIAGEQRLMLPASDSYLEIVTPAGNPPFNGTVRAGGDGYFARALNNTGAECYPTNTAIPQANCPPAGHINPANGNIWLPITDATAFGAMLNLELSRHYNSAYADLDSPFGKGWSSVFLLDYNVLFDTVTNSRIVTPVTIASYAIGLDVTYAPRGVVTFITPTGSRHQFVGDANTLRAVTMPGWRLFRASISDIWRLVQDNGQVFEFDRAGRLIRYGYPTYGRMVKIDYPRANLNGAADIGQETPVIITDHLGDFAPRRLELYYNSDHRIVKSIMRDMTIGADETTCVLADNCIQTTYTYSPDGLLTGVAYADGTVAEYRYDEFGRLVRFNDPRAPITQSMSMTYNADGEVIITEVQSGSTPFVYQQADVDISANTRTSTITDRLGNRVRHTYTLSAGDLRAVGTSYQLTQTTSPLAGTGDALEDVPTSYRWGSDQTALVAGFLTRIEARGTGANQGRGSIIYDYTPNGQLRCVSCSLDNAPKLEIIYDQPPELHADIFRPVRVNYADGTNEQFTYDTNGLLTRYIDRQGADYSLIWTETAPYQLSQMTRANDGTVWDYLYNPVGQIVSMVQTVPDDTLPYQVSYQWDGLGRLIGVTDGVLGIYTIEYPAPVADDNGNIFTQVHQIDPIGGNTISVFDSRGNLIETRVELDGVVIQKTTRQYDVLGREIITTEWLGEMGDAELIPMQTITDYIATTSYTNSANQEVVVRGETVRITDPYGRASSTIYDALGRVRCTVDHNGTVKDFRYSASAVEDTTLTFGLQITQQTALQGTPFSNRADYFFDAARQLRRVRVGVGGVNDATPIAQEWAINLNGNTNRLRSMNISVAGRAFGLREVTWGDYVNGQPATVNMSLTNIALNSNFNVESNQRPTMGATYDFLGRVTSISTGEGAYNIAYCSVSTGGTLVVYGALNTPVNCTADTASQTLRYDVHGRLIEATDAYGRRSMTYTPNVALGAWDVAVALSSDTGEDTWALQFDSVGNLTQWVDQNGVVHEYRYDTRGRLIATSVADMPEMSYTFKYNHADQLIEEVDELGRGWLYNYDPQGRVISKVDKKTADAISYSYTPNGLISAVTNSDGGTTVYLYEDRSNPTRLTRIIEPTGAQHRFRWADDLNTLVYTDPFNNETRYLYDGTGLLWRMDDPTPRSSEVLYDDGGRITDVLTNVTSASAVSRRFTLTRPAPQTITVSDSTPNGTGWSRNLSFYHDGVLAQSGNVQFGYDALGRLVRVGLEGQDSWTIGWVNSSVINVTEPFAGASVLSYDAMHRLISRSARNTEITYTYSVGDNRIPVMQINHPIYGVRDYAFSPGDARTGEPPTVFMRAHGQETAYVYDGDGRLRDIITRTCSDDQAVTLTDCQIIEAPIYQTRATITYNSAGLPIRISDADGALETFAYDDMGNLIGYQNANGRNFAYGYDAGGRLIRITSATGVKLLLGYNPLGNMTGICQTRISEPDDFSQCVANGGSIETYAYDTLGRLTNRASGNISRNFTYNANSQLTRMGDITFSYIPNTGLLSQMLVANGGEYTFNYASVNRIASVGDIGFTYNALGDLLGQNDRITNVALNFDQQTQTLTFTDSTSRLAYRLDERGHLVGIGLNDTPILTVNYPTIQEAVDLIWTDQTEIAYTLNNRRETQNLIFVEGANQMSVFYDLTGTGGTRKQNIILPFAQGGYVAIYGYDNDERPVTLRITDFNGLTVLFAQSITYNADGVRESETWQYADGTQVFIRYRYEADRLLERTVNILGNQNRTLAYRYEYDNNGNITRITETTSAVECANMRYDGANRLVSITREAGATPLAYDAYGRLISAGDVRVSYRGAGADVLALAVGRDVYYVGAVQNQPAQFLVGRGGDVTWLVNDGRRRTLLPYTADTDPLTEIWLFDALGRYVPLTTPDFANPCNLNGLPANLTPALSVQPLADGALWLPNLGLYIQNGRAYETETGLYTQRANVVDALGDLYTAQTGNIVPYPTAHRTDGLRLLRDATQRGQINAHLSAQTVLATHLPHIADDTSPLMRAQHGAQTPVRRTSQQLLFLADWLKQAYNLPNGYRDDNGYLRLPMLDAPAQGGYGGDYQPPFDMAIPDWDTLLMTSIQPSQAILRDLMDDLRPITPVTTYQTQFSPTPLLMQTWQHRPVSAPITADAVLEWLPTPLAHPQYGASALDFADLLADMWRMTNMDWVDERLEAHLPRIPDLPPLTLDDWRDTAFRDDILDPLAGYGAVLPPLPDMPRYPWGNSPDWLGVGR